MKIPEQKLELITTVDATKQEVGTQPFFMLHSFINRSAFDGGDCFRSSPRPGSKLNLPYMHPRLVFFSLVLEKPKISRL
jgi:hypothetical protein